MDQLIKLVRTYRLTEGLAERLQLGDEIFRLVEPKLRFFVFGSLASRAAEDVHQETLKAVAAGLGGFAGATPQEFWAWCYRIARNKVNDHLRKQAAHRSDPMPPEELWRLAEHSAADSSISPADRLDLEHALQLLRQSKPECYDYLWKHFILGLAYADIAEEQNLTYDNVRMRVGRSLDEAQTLVSCHRHARPALRLRAQAPKARPARPRRLRSGKSRPAALAQHHPRRNSPAVAKRPRGRASAAGSRTSRARAGTR